MPFLAAVRRTLTASGKFVLDAVAPLRCLGCNRIGTIACPDCLAKVEVKVTTTPGPEPLQAVVSVADYEAPLPQQLIHTLKYHGVTAAAEPLGAWLAKAAAFAQPGDVLVPVPLHPRRKRQRGFNQSELLAKKLSTVTGLPVIQFVQRTRNTKPQVECDGDERRKNLHNAFAAEAVDAKRIILVDDVTTTGSTFVEIAKALRKVTSVPVIGLAVGRG